MEDKMSELKKYSFKKINLKSRIKIDKQLQYEFKIHDFNDIMNNALFKQIEAFFYKRESERIFIEQTFDRSTFLDWLLRKKRTLSVEINAKDVLLDPPEYNEDVIRLYEFKV